MIILRVLMQGMLNKISKLEKYELLAIIIVAGFHIGLEIFVSLKASIIFTVISVGIFTLYLILRAINNRGVFREWGFRSDNFKKSIPAYFCALILGFIFLYLIGTFSGGVLFSKNLLIGLLVYPFWGIAQQFVLQNFVVRHIVKRNLSTFLAIFFANILFALSHTPKFLLGGLAFLAGMVITFIYQKYPNLWLAGIVHGLLATLALYWIFKLDFLKIFL